MPAMTTLPLAFALSLATAACGGEDGAPADATTGDTTSSDATTPADTTPDPTETAAETTPVRGLGIDWEAEASPKGAAPRYEPTSADYTATPWPTDRLRVNGHPTLSNFPNPDANPLIADYLAYGEEVLDGWSTNGAIFVQVAAAIDPTTLPSAAASRDDARAHVQLVELGDASPTRGDRVPLVFQYVVKSSGDSFYLGDTLVIRPVYGFPLRPATTYCALVTRAVKDTGGGYLQPAAAFTSALAAEPSLAPLRDWLPTSPLFDTDLAVATCFTTQDPTKDMRIVSDFLDTRPSEPPLEWVYKGAAAFHHEFEGKYRTPNFQSGEKPYRDLGGDMILDAGGVPIVQLDEEVRFRLLVPKNYTMDAVGWPVVLYSHGTFGDWKSCLGNEALVVRDGLAMICVDQPLHGTRGVEDPPLYLDVFNFLNPPSGRMSFRQSAIDTLWLSKMVSDGRFNLPAGTTAYTKELILDPSRIVFFGHSHGGLAGAIALAIDPRLQAGVLSGASGVLVQTILLRKDPFDIRSTLAQVLNLDENVLDTFHPVLNLAQMLVDATDPINYSPYWNAPRAGGKAKHVFMTEGTADAQSPSVGADAVAAAGNLPQLNPVAQESPAHVLRGIAGVPAPVKENITTPTGERVTGGLHQFGGADHFVALTRDDVIALWRLFFAGLSVHKAPTIAP